MKSAAELLDLLDWKRRVFDLYSVVRNAQDPLDAWNLWRSTRQRLFRQHPQSPVPIEQRATFDGPHYFSFDPAMRVPGELIDAPLSRIELPMSDGGTYVFQRIAEVRFELLEQPLSLDVYWLESYGGGLFIPFRDATAGKTSYGAGRYLFDTVKGADLGTEGSSIVMDFNFSYQPSCSYDPSWACPLAPKGNQLAVDINAGERTG